MRITGILTILVLAVLTKVNADVDITAPVAGKSFSPSGGSFTIDIVWEDDSTDDTDTTSLTEVSGYTISLCTGLNTNIECFKTLLSNKLPTGTNYTATIKSTDAPNGYFFFQIYAVFSTGYTIHYSDRFQLTGMSGVTVTPIQGTTTTLILTATGSPPAAQLAAGANSIDTKSFTLSYTQQSGKTKFAPMQTQPGSTVTATTWQMQYPTSAVTYYSSLAGTANAITTATPGWDYTPTSLANWASVAPYPTYFYPASERVSKATLSSAAKKKRWLD